MFVNIMRQRWYGAGGFSYKSTWTLQELCPLSILVVNFYQLRKNTIRDKKKPHIFCRFTKESQSVTRAVGSLSNRFRLFFLLLWKIGGWEGRDRPTPPQYNPASISPYNSLPPVNPTVLPIPGMAESSVLEEGGTLSPPVLVCFSNINPTSATVGKSHLWGALLQ